MRQGFLETEYKWDNRSVRYCLTCSCFYITCEDCKNSSCNGSGCDKCCGNTEETNFSLSWSKNYTEITKDWIITDEMKKRSRDYDELEELFKQ